MKKELKDKLIETVGEELRINNFFLADSSNRYFVFHRKTDSFIDIIQIGQDKYEKYLTVIASIVFLNAPKEKDNVHYPMFYEFNGDIDKISADDCIDKCFLKGNFGNAFHYGKVYLALGRGIVGVGPNARTPIGIRLQNVDKDTYEKVCNLIIKRLKQAYSWLDKKKQIN